MQNNQNNYSNLSNNDNINIKNIINNALLNINTLFPAKINAIDDGDTGLRYTIETILLPVTINQQVPAGLTISNVPASHEMGGNYGLIIPYKINDIVLCGAIQRDISSLKDNNWAAQPNLPSLRKFSLSDAIIIKNISNQLPTIYIKFSDDGIEITAPSKQVIVNATEVDVNADTVKLGNGANKKVLLEDVTLTAQITGVTSGSDTVLGTITVNSGGSSKVQGAE